MNPLIGMTAVALRDALAGGEVTPAEALDALEARVAEVDGAVNALPTRCFERARERAGAVRRDSLLAGMPVPIKDLTDVAGVRTTYGSPAFADHVPEASDVLVERLEANGALVCAKSNTPEFGAGAHTFNPVLGLTRNPHDTRLSAAGSSGGAAAALATGQAWLAHGSDMGGSLRNPASFCGVVGLRPSPGRVAKTPVARIDDTLSVEGPMARNVLDAALMLDAMCGVDARDPLSMEPPATPFLAAAREGHPPARVAFSATLGFMPVDGEVAAITEAAAMRFTEAGAAVEEGHPDLADAHEVFGVLRARSFATGLFDLYRTRRETLKPEIVWNVEQGLALSFEVLRRAETARARMFASATAFFRDFDLLLCPATVAPPFPVEERYMRSCAGVEFRTYVEWLGIVYAITLIACPALSLPCGFTRAGLPVGLQIVAPPRGEARLLGAARALEAILGLDLRPIDPRVRHDPAAPMPPSLL
jgi:amidase